MRLSALSAGRALFPGIFLVLTCVRGWVYLKAKVRLEDLGKLTNPVTSSGFEPVTFRLIANQLRYRVHMT
jgi:hypothetical protein